MKNGTVATSETFQLIELFKNFTKDSKVRKQKIPVYKNIAI